MSGHGGSGLGRRELWLVGLLVLVLFLGALLASRAEQASSVAVLFGRSSTYGTGPGGLKGLYLFLARSGLRVERWRTPLAGSVLPDGTLCLVAPRRALSRLEQDALQRWIDRGNSLLLVVGDRGTPAAEMANLLGFGVRRTRAYAEMLAARDDDETEDGPGIPEGPSGEGQAMLDSIAPASARPEPVVLESADGARLPGVAVVAVDAAVRFDAPDTADVLLHDTEGAVLAELGLGRGRVLALAGSHPLTNAGLGRRDAAVLADRLFRMTASYDRPILFDEYHQGFSQGTGLFALLAGHPAGLALGEVLILVFLFLAARGRAFGRARRSDEAPRREAAEQIRAFARLYRRGRASGLALEILRRDAWAAVTSRLSLSRGADERELARRAAAHLELPEERVRAALQTPAAGVHTIETRSLTARARLLARIAERMRHGRGR